jgi:hypothetical protein
MTVLGLSEKRPFPYLFYQGVTDGSLYVARVEMVPSACLWTVKQA